MRGRASLSLHLARSLATCAAAAANRVQCAVLCRLAVPPWRVFVLRRAFSRLATLPSYLLLTCLHSHFRRIFAIVYFAARLLGNLVTSPAFLCCSELA